MTPQIETLQDVQITGLTADSRRVEPGFLFAALPSVTLGSGTDGRDYIGDAVARGAVAVLAPPGTELTDAAQLVVDENPRRQLALLAARFYQRQPKTIAAVTGTELQTVLSDCEPALNAHLIDCIPGHIGRYRFWAHDRHHCRGRPGCRRCRRPGSR